jgi:hypothetical protein
MGPFNAVLYVHVIATLGLVAAMGAEGHAISQLWRVTERRESPAWEAPMTLMSVVASICLLVLFLSGGYLTGRAGLWSMAWPKIAVGIIVAFGALAGLSSRRLRKIRRAPVNGKLPDAEITRELQAPFLAISLGIRTGLVLAAVWLMTAKPGFVGSLGVVLALVSISWGVAALISPRAKALSALAADPKLQRSAR